MSLNVKKNALYDVMGIGSALLDLTMSTDDAMLGRLGLKKGEMHLIDAGRSREILEMLSGLPMDVTPGGSSANAIAGVMNFGGSAIFNGKVGSDPHGDLYINETRKTGAHESIKRDSGMTGHAITFITPDSERTFATHLGAAIRFNRDDVDLELLKKSRILHLEGYLFEPPDLKEACMTAMKAAGENGVLISIDLSDPALIGRIHDTFTEVLMNYADIVFVNEEEALAFTGKKRESALDELYSLCSFAVVKLGSEGSMLKSGGVIHRIPVFKTDVVNTNGAGDMFAAGTLYGISHGYDSYRCGLLGSFGASLVVSEKGARVREKIDTGKIIL